LKKEVWVAPANYPFDDEFVVPYQAGDTIGWKLI
jgi:dihydroorotase